VRRESQKRSLKVREESFSKAVSRVQAELISSARGYWLSGKTALRRVHKLVDLHSLCVCDLYDGVRHILNLYCRVMSEWCRFFSSSYQRFEVAILARNETIPIRLGVSLQEPVNHPAHKKEQERSEPQI